MTKKHTKQALAALTAGLLSLLLLTACGSQNAAVGSGQDSAADTNGQTQTGQTEQGDQSAQSTVTTVGEFTTQDLDGSTVTQDIFKEHKLTLVNAFGTWCSPCVQEIPDLEKLYETMQDKGVGVIGIVTDTIGMDGKLDQTVVDTAKQLAEQSGVTYPFLVPDAGWLNGRLANMDTFPESFFVDENGNIVGETYFGSRDLAEWTSVVETELANLEKNA